MSGLVDIVVEATLRRVGDLLELAYGVENRGAGAVWLVDDMLGHVAEGFVRQPRALVVRAGDDPTTVRLIRGHEPPRATVFMYFEPGARRLAPGERLTGEAETPLPLAECHPQERPRPLAAAPTHAIVEVTLLLVEEPELAERPVIDGPPALIPRRRSALVSALSQPLPLP